MTPGFVNHPGNRAEDSHLASLVECPHSSLAVNVDCHEIAVPGRRLAADDYPVTVRDGQIYRDFAGYLTQEKYSLFQQPGVQRKDLNV